MTIDWKHPVVVVMLASALGFGGASLQAYMRTPLDIGVLVVQMAAMQLEVQRLTIAVENSNKRIDAILMQDRERVNAR